MEIKAIFFDVGGVILNYEIPRQRLLDKYEISNERWRKGFTPELVDRSHKGEMSLDDYIKTGLRGLGLEDKWRELRAIYPGGFIPMNATLEFIENIKDKYLIGIITNIHKGMLEEWFSKYGYRELFKVIINSSVEKIVKPEKEIYLLAIQRSGYKPGECLMVDDLEENIEGAKAVGMKTVLFKDQLKGVKKIKALLEI